MSQEPLDLPPVDAGLFQPGPVFAEPCLAGLLRWEASMIPGGRNGGPPGRRPRRAPLAQLPQRSRPELRMGEADFSADGVSAGSYPLGHGPVRSPCGRFKPDEPVASGECCKQLRACIAPLP